MSAENTSNENTKPTGTTSNGSLVRTDQDVPSQELPSGKSSQESIRPKDETSYDLLKMKPGGQRDVLNKATNALITVTEKTSKAKLSAESKAILSTFVETMSHGFAGSMIMICKGRGCPVLNSCPIYQAGGTLPVGSKCPVEAISIATWVNKHLQALGIEDINSPDHSFDMDMLYELAGQELIRWRCAAHLSERPALVQEKMVGATPHGEPIFADVITPVLEVMERAGKNVAKLREALVATREAQIKAGRDNMDPSQKQADLRAKALQAIEHRMAGVERVKLINNNEKVQPADYEIKEIEE